MFTIVAVPEIISSFPNLTRLFPGENAFIELDFFGFPSPTLYWLRDGTTFVNNTDGVSYVIGVNTSILSIIDSNGQSGGHYAANASSSGGITLREFIIECKYFGKHSSIMTL